MTTFSSSSVQLKKSVILHVAVLLDVLTRCQENSSRTYSLGSNTSCGCALRCLDKVSGEQQQNLFSGFWDRADFNVQNAYLCGYVKVVDIAK